MAEKTNFTPKTILDLEFSPDEKGYKTLEVDETLDKIIHDYEVFEKELNSLKELNAKNDVELETLRKKLRDAEIENGKLRQKIQQLPKESGVTMDNYKLLKAKEAYERFLYKKGYNPEKILSDPDNC